MRSERKSRQDDHGDMTGGGICFYALGCAPPIHPRQRNVHDDHVRKHVASNGDRLLSVRRLNDAKADVLEVLRVHESIVVVVVDEENGPP